jgi:hypothetical protein
MSFGHDMQRAGDLMCFEFVNHPQGRRFERVLCFLHELVGHAVAPALQHRAQCGRHVYVIKVGCSLHDQLADLHRDLQSIIFSLFPSSLS